MKEKEKRKKGKKRSLAALICAVLALCAAPALAAGVEEEITEHLLTGLLKESARVIKDAYGIDGRIGNKLTVLWDDDPLTKPLPSNAYAAAEGNWGIPYDTVLVLNHDVFNNSGAMASPAGREELFLTILHELTHGMQFTSEPGLKTFIQEDPTARNIGKAQFLYEGMAEYAAGGNDRVLGYARKQRQASKSDAEITRAILIGMKMAMSTSPNVGGYDPTEAGAAEMFYIGSYLATRWFDTESKNAGGTGIKGLISYLEANSGGQGENSHVLDAAIRIASNGRWGEYADLVNETINQENDASSRFYPFVLGVVREDSSVDAGRVGGWYATRDASRKQSRREAAESLVGHARDESPLAGYGFVKMTLFGRDYQSEPTPPGGGGSGGGGDVVPPPAPGAHDGEVDAARSSGSWSSSRADEHVVVYVKTGFEKFTGVVSLDGALLARDTATTSRDFGAREGSTVITVWSRALKERVKASGAHYISVGFDDGVASHKFTATAAGAPEPSPNVPGGSSGGGGCAAGAALPLLAATMLAKIKRARRADRKKRGA